MGLTFQLILIKQALSALTSTGSCTVYLLHQKSEAMYKKKDKKRGGHTGKRLKQGRNDGGGIKGATCRSSRLRSATKGHVSWNSTAVVLQIPVSGEASSRLDTPAFPSRDSTWAPPLNLFPIHRRFTVPLSLPLQEVHLSVFPHSHLSVPLQGGGERHVSWGANRVHSII